MEGSLNLPLRAAATRAGLLGRLEAALAAAELAGRIALAHLRGLVPGDVVLKAGHDFVSRADADAEMAIRAHLAASGFGGDAVLGEEGGATPGEGALWVVDPIDGTANYVHQLPDWSVSLAVMVGGRTRLGVVHAPALRETFVALEGGGAWLHGERLRAPRIEEPGRALIEVDSGSAVPQEEFLALVAAVTGLGFDTRRVGSGALSLCRVAAGRRHGYAELFTRPWDALAGLLAVREAGGWASDFEEGLLTRGGNPLFACAPGLEPAFQGLSRRWPRYPAGEAR